MKKEKKKRSKFKEIKTTHKNRQKQKDKIIYYKK